MLESRLIYASAVFDCLGGIGFSVDHSGSFIPQMYVTSSCFYLLDYTWTTFGIGNIREVREGVWTWYVNSQSSILFILKNYTPYLISKSYDTGIMIQYLTSRAEHREHNAPYTKMELQCILELVKPRSKTAEAAREKLYGKSSSNDHI